MSHSQEIRLLAKGPEDAFWHHGIMDNKGKEPGQFFVVDSFPHEGQPSVQRRTLEDFLNDAVAAAIVYCGPKDQKDLDLLRSNAL